MPRLADDARAAACSTAALASCASALARDIGRNDDACYRRLEEGRLRHHARRRKRAPRVSAHLAKLQLHPPTVLPPTVLYSILCGSFARDGGVSAKRCAARPQLTVHVVELFRVFQVASQSSSG